MSRVLGALCLTVLALTGARAPEAGDASYEVRSLKPPANATPVIEKTPPPAPGPSIEITDDTFVVICPIDREIDEGLAVVVERAARAADGAAALLFVIDTPGGQVGAAIDITSSIMSVKCPTLAFVKGMGALSAGALISYSCDYIYMAEGSNIGASTPIMPGVETTPAMDEKSNSVIRAKYRALGEANGHDPILGEAMVDRNMEVRAYRNPDGTYHIFEVDPAKSELARQEQKSPLDVILDSLTSGSGEGGEELKKAIRELIGAQDKTAGAPSADRQEAADEYRALLEANTELVSARGELLTMTAKEATHFGLAKGITTDVDDTLRELYLGSVKRLEITPTWEEALFFFLTSPTVAGLLLLIGLGSIYVEIRTPGFGGAGILGAACLALFFGSHMVIGMADWLDLALILIGFILVLAEIFLLPGFGIAGVAGFACLIVGAYLALVKAPFPETFWEYKDTEQALYTLCVAMFSFIGFVVVSGFLLPYTPLGRALVLTAALDSGEGYTAQTAEVSLAATGLVGTAATRLRPSGKGRFGDQKLDVVTRGEFLDEGTPIMIINSDGNRHVVSRIE